MDLGIRYHELKRNPIGYQHPNYECCLITGCPTHWHGPRNLILCNDSQPYRVSMTQVSILSDEWLSRYGFLEIYTTEKSLLKVFYILTSSATPTPWHGPRNPMPWNEGQPYRVSMAQVSMFSDDCVMSHCTTHSFEIYLPLLEGRVGRSHNA